MKNILLKISRLFRIASIIFTFAATAATIRAESAAQIGNNLFSISDSPLSLPFSPATPNLRFVPKSFVQVTNVEELYSAINNPNNVGNQIVIAPGVYLLSVNDANGAARPNGGRLELQQNMSLHGVFDNRAAVVIDAVNLPTSSLTTVVSMGLPATTTATIRMGRGANAVEWLTVRNVVNGSAGIETDLLGTGTAFIRIAHIISTGNLRGIDVRNFGPSAANRVIDADITDNEFFNNILSIGEGMRFANIQGANGGSVTARLNGNRSHGNKDGMLVVNNRSSNASVSVSSSGDRFYENGSGTLVVGGLSSGSTAANGNMTTFTAEGSFFENNNGTTEFDKGGLVILGGENTAIPNGTSNNTVNVELRNCRFGNNQLYDIGAFAARSNPVHVGLPGTNNRVTITLHDLGHQTPNIVSADSILVYPAGMNSVIINR